MKRTIIYLLGLILIFPACQSGTVPGGGSSSGGGQNFPDWLIPRNQVYDGGVGKDGIPALLDPGFGSQADAEYYMRPTDLVLGIKIGDEIRGYPHPILDWHEIINDKIGDDAFAVTYCPLTGTGIGWGRVLDGQETTFGVSGLIYNSNLIPYDRGSNSNWSQMRNDCVNGQFEGSPAEYFHLVEMEWTTWKEMYPDASVLSRYTGHSRSYGEYPYGNYKTDNEYMLFPLLPDDLRLERKERVLGVILDGEAKVYRFAAFNEQVIDVVQDQFKGMNLVVVGSNAKNFMVAYNRLAPDGVLLDFTPIQNGQDAIMEDQEGNQWNIFGEAVSGPRQGQSLNRPVNYMGYWLAWGAFYPGAEIHGN